MGKTVGTPLGLNRRPPSFTRRRWRWGLSLNTRPEVPGALMGLYLQVVAPAAHDEGTSLGLGKKAETCWAKERCDSRHETLILILNLIRIA